jgi:hypothetical protein
VRRRARAKTFSTLPARGSSCIDGVAMNLMKRIPLRRLQMSGRYGPARCKIRPLQHREQLPSMAHVALIIRARFELRLSQSKSALTRQAWAAQAASRIASNWMSHCNRGNLWRIVSRAGEGW